MKIQYPIFANYVQDWGVEDAIREIIANAFDQETEETSSKAIIEYNEEKQTLTVTNKDTLVSIDALYFGETKKSKDNRFIGQHGEGLKLAMLVFARDPSIQCKIYSGNYKWLPSLEFDKIGRKTFTVNVTPFKTEDPKTDFVVTIKGVNPKTWENVKSKFIRLHKLQKVTSLPSGSILLDPNERGRIYVRGVFCATIPNSLYGYDVKKIETGRDRRVPDTWELRAAIATLWEEWVANSLNIDTVYKILETGGFEADAITDNPSTKLKMAIRSVFCEKHGDAIPVKSPEEADIFGHFLLKTVIVSTELWYVLKDFYPSIVAYREALRTSVKVEYADEDLQPEERQNISYVRDVLSYATAKANLQSLPIKVVDFHTYNLTGLYKNNTAYISKKILNNLAKTIVIAIHEVAHQRGPDGCVEHVFAMMDLMCHVLEREYSIRDQLVAELGKRPPTNQRDSDVGASAGVDSVAAGSAGEVDDRN
jgi:hypothetical protein